MINFKYFFLISLCLHGAVFFGVEPSVITCSSAASPSVTKVSVHFSQVVKEPLKEKQKEIQNVTEEKQKINKTADKGRKIPSPQKQEVKQIEKGKKQDKKENKNLQQEIFMQEHKNVDVPTIGQENAPLFAHFVPPKYPERARRMNIEGTVLLRVLVGTDGKAKEIEVVQASHSLFVNPAKKSVQQSSFTPLTVRGNAQESWVKIPLKFILR